MWPIGVYGYAGADGRPFAAASVKHGIVVGEVSLVTLPSHRHSEDGRSHPAAEAGNKVCTKLTYLFELVVAAFLGHLRSFQQYWKHYITCYTTSYHVTFCYVLSFPFMVYDTTVCFCMYCILMNFAILCQDVESYEPLYHTLFR